MIYINQIGFSELGRGETLELAIADALKWGFKLDADLTKQWRPGWPVMDGAVVWVDEPMKDYND